MSDPVLLPLTSFLEDLPPAAEVKAYVMAIQQDLLRAKAEALIETILRARDEGETSVTIPEELPEVLVAELTMKGYQVDLPPAIFDRSVTDLTTQVRWDEVEVKTPGPQDVVRKGPRPQEDGGPNDPLWKVLEEQES